MSGGFNKTNPELKILRKIENPKTEQIQELSTVILRITQKVNLFRKGRGRVDGALTGGSEQKKNRVF